MVAEKQLDSLMLLKDEVLADLGMWSETQLRYKPAPAEWSALEIVDHLARTDAGITAQMCDKARAPLPLSLANRVAGAAFNVMFRSPIRVKTPATASAILPVCPQNLATASANWGSALDDLRTFLLSMEVEPLGAVFQHPVAGPMSLSTALDFMETHTRHHFHQLTRVRKSSGVASHGV